MLLLFLESLGVLFLPLPRVKSAAMLVALEEKELVGFISRCLPVPQQPFLLLEFLEFLLVASLVYECINGPEITLCGNFEARILLTNTITS